MSRTSHIKHNLTIFRTNQDAWRAWVLYAKSHPNSTIAMLEPLDVRFSTIEDIQDQKSFVEFFETQLAILNVCGQDHP